MTHHCFPKNALNCLSPQVPVFDAHLLGDDESCETLKRFMPHGMATMSLPNHSIHKLLLMGEILHRLGCIKPDKQWDKLPVNWCKISAINSMTDRTPVHSVRRENLPRWL